MSAMNFRVTLLRVNEQLSSQQLENLKFLSRTVIPNAHMDRIRQSLDLFDVLEQRGKLSPNNIDFLRMLLESADCSDALRELQYIPSRGSEQEDQEFHFRKCLLRIAVELSSVEFDNLKFTLKERLQQSTDRIYSATHLFQLLIQRQIVTSTDLRALYELLFNMGRKDLSEVVNRYMLDIGRQPYQMFHQGTCSCCNVQLLVNCIDMLHVSGKSLGFPPSLGVCFIDPLMPFDPKSSAWAYCLPPDHHLHIISIFPTLPSLRAVWNTCSFPFHALNSRNSWFIH